MEINVQTKEQLKVYADQNNYPPDDYDKLLEQVAEHIGNIKKLLALLLEEPIIDRNINIETYTVETPHNSDLSLIQKEQITEALPFVTKGFKSPERDTKMFGLRLNGIGPTEIKEQIDELFPNEQITTNYIQKRISDMKKLLIKHLSTN